MSRLLDELAEVLGRELEITRRLLDLAKDARAAVTSADAELLAGIVGEQEQWSAWMEEAELRRAVLAADLGRELGLAGTPRLADIAGRAPAEAGLRLRNVGRKLKDVADELRRTGERNGALLCAAAQQIDGFFEALARALREAAGYRADGQERRVRAAVAVDRTA